MRAKPAPPKPGSKPGLKAPSAERVPRARVRRGNTDDALRLRADIINAALAIFDESGLDAVSMRAVATRVGVSAMTPYRYFADKAELLTGLWRYVLDALHEQLAAAVQAGASARERHHALAEAFVSYCEQHPDHYRLVYMTRITNSGSLASHLTQVPIYARVLELTGRITHELALEIGGDVQRCKLAGDIRFAMFIGYLHATLINQRFPWGDRKVLRAAYIEQALAAVERCLTEGLASAPAAQTRPRKRGAPLKPAPAR